MASNPLIVKGLDKHIQLKVTALPEIQTPESRNFQQTIVSSFRCFMNANRNDNSYGNDNTVTF
jgi:hypothetical protein